MSRDDDDDAPQSDPEPESDPEPQSDRQPESDPSPRGESEAAVTRGDPSVPAATAKPGSAPPHRAKVRKKGRATRKKTGGPAVIAVAPAEAAASERRPRQALAGGAATLLIGLALVGIEASDVGMVLSLLGLVTLIYGVHAFGRLGPPVPTGTPRTPGPSAVET
jgi:hypothetical protein